MSHHRLFRTSIILLCAVLGLSACNVPPAIPLADTPTSASMQTPTFAPTATAPVSPTSTPLPSPTTTLIPPTSPPASFPAPLQDRVVFTYYFYWYDSETQFHLQPYGQDPNESLTDQPPPDPPPTWRGTAWHRKQLEDMVYAGIDVLLPVYWINRTFRSEPTWSESGLESLALALEETRLAGITPPSVGMFFDTTPLDGVDLSIEEERAFLYDGIQFFFSTIPRDYWALVDEHTPIIWFYSGGYPHGYDESFFDDLHGRFQQDFGVRPYLVFSGDWFCDQLANGGLGYCDATYSWGGATSPLFTSDITSIGPGYDDSDLLQRNNLIHVDRLGGTTYRNALIRATLYGGPWLVIETWNEYHEGTDIAESVQYGREYLDISRRFITYFKQGNLPSDARIESESSSSLSLELKLASPIYNGGLTLGPSMEDGQYESVIIQGKTAVRTIPMSTDAQESYLYFRVDDGFYFLEPSTLTMSVDFLDEGYEPINIQYDTARYSAPWNASTMYKDTLLVHRTNTGTWRTAQITLTDASFANHQNWWADFRLSTGRTPLTVSSVRLDKAP